MNLLLPPNPGWNAAGWYDEASTSIWATITGAQDVAEWRPSGVWIETSPGIWHQFDGAFIMAEQLWAYDDDGEDAPVGSQIRIDGIPAHVSAEAGINIAQPSVALVIEPPPGLKAAPGALNHVIEAGDER